ncbi:hypothetical protein EKL98_08590 [Flavobacterium bomense]|uniref:Uncharacterized protein n=1 Tax=Flavobacterium bomense TaxID=2497483 RepID=A0A432CM86_9FLAO|nr:hypothetical protein [Flavobacterium bomense]RTZ04598.1 hypothetical protein EKL98_08590 [Flavobacterium bomense]
MSFFSTLLLAKNLPKHDGRPLWKYMFNDEDYEKLLEELKLARPLSIDPRDVTMYYAEWWKKNYNGGTPSKFEIFNSLNGNVRHNFNQEDFFKLAVTGARMLGIKWITRQNTLYFRTLLLQGGLPLSHISENQGIYLNFLIAVLEEQPETIEDFIFKPHITGLLPLSSQNKDIYENCFEIVKSFLNKEDIYDELFKESEALKAISNTLKAREKLLIRKQRFSKPKNYWLLSFKKEKISIILRIGLADSYNSESLSNILGFEVTGKEYQFYVNEELICVFRKMINGNFKTDWYNQQNQEWNGVSNLPYTYVIKDGEKHEVTDFIETIPNLKEPSLWSRFSDNEWRLIKGNGTSNNEAAILFPADWYSNLLTMDLSLYEEQLSWLTFEGEVEICNQQQVRKYLSGVNSFECTIVSKKPAWMLKASMPVVNSIPNVIIYDENSNRLPDSKSKIWIRKHNSNESWEGLSKLHHIPLGCIDIKIEKEGLIAYDMFFNIGNLKAKYATKAIDNAEIEINNLESFEFKLDESPILKIQQLNNKFSLKVNTEYSKIPTGIKGSLGQKNQKKLYFEMASPFEGMAITNADGKVITEVEKLTLANLYGLRILSTPNTGTILRIKNRLKTEVIITKEIKESSQPIISFLEEITRLYYLADAMDYRNKVCLELIEGSKTKTYEITGFSHTLNVEKQFENNVSLQSSEDELDLYAIPLNCKSENIELIPLVRNELYYTIPSTEITNQFIVISSTEKGKQLMPRYVNTNEEFVEISKKERMDQFHSQLLEENFDGQIWKQSLTYFTICIKNHIPFSTFDQLRAISRSSKVAARAFLFLGINQEETDFFIQKAIPEMEKDLGFCFHWIKNEDWGIALNELDELYKNQYFVQISGLISLYMRENGFDDILKFIMGENIKKENILYSDIREVRALLGERVLKELPRMTPKITKEYNISINEHLPVKLLLRAPIAVAESINDTPNAYPIWAGDDHRESIRRNIQYSQYLNSEFYSRVILQALKN